MGKTFGDEYPAAVVEKGVRMPLAIETPFSRYYHSGEPKRGGLLISRFMDGSASMTMAELQRDWPSWTDEQRVDFCQSCIWLHEQADYADMLRFIMGHGSPSVWGATALQVATALPSDEAFPLLLGVLRATIIGQGANITHAIAKTKHRDAKATLQQHLRAVWEHPGLWADDEWLNWIALDTTTCIEHLIELGESPADFEDRVRRLSQHVCPQNRDSCRNYLSKHYSWLK
jgi:hypothetical protein